MSSVISMLEQTAKAGRAMSFVDDETINKVICRIADDAEASAKSILEANSEDLSRMDPSNPMYDRLMLTPERIHNIASDMRNVAALPSPIGKLIEKRTLPNGLQIRKVSVPLGVIGMIYEARPNVTFDVFSLCFKAGNAAVLKGGSDASSTNEVIVSLIKKVLYQFNIDENTVCLLPNDRNATFEMLQADKYVDVIIPRGSSSLIKFVRENSKVPVIETGAGICHTYFEKSGDAKKGQAIVTNAKTRRVSVCNALDCLIIDKERLNDLSFICEKLADKNVTIYADPDAYEVLETNYPAKLLKAATEDSFGTEFLDYKMAIRSVSSFSEAIEHIEKYSSKHSEAIISEDKERIEQFFRMVDAAAVYANASTSFTDGAQFGLGAEIGISTQKLHARGPMGLAELTSYKWLIEGDGQTRA